MANQSFNVKNIATQVLESKQPQSLCKVCKETDALGRQLKDGLCCLCFENQHNPRCPTKGCLLQVNETDDDMDESAPSSHCRRCLLKNAVCNKCKGRVTESEILNISSEGWLRQEPKKFCSKCENKDKPKLCKSCQKNPVRKDFHDRCKSCEEKQCSVEKALLEKGKMKMCQLGCGKPVRKLDHEHCPDCHALLQQLQN